MRKFRRKKGSSLIMVVFITAIIFTTATSMIALVTSDYKHRINESKRIQNLYQAESGLDIVKNIIVKSSDAAVVYANAKTRDYIKDNQDIIILTAGTDDAVYGNVNNKFKDLFMEFLGKIEHPLNTLVPSTYEHPLGVTNPSPVEPLIFSMLNNEYLQLVDPNAADTVRGSTVNASSGDYKWIKIPRTIDANKQDAKIEILSYLVDTTNYKITIEVRSTFNTKDSVDGAINKKVIETKFIVDAPDYTQEVKSSSIPVETKLYPIQKAIVTDNNINIGTGRTYILGDVWAQGSTNNVTSNYAYKKYDSGIFIDGGGVGATVDVNGNVYTNSTFNVINKATSTINKNLYASNVYVGPRVVSDTSEDNTLTVDDSIAQDLSGSNEVITNNDLTLNSTTSHVKIATYYGVNDITSNPTKITADGKNGLAKESSSIIINKNVGSDIKIGSAYVMGVSYVNTDEAYATGESIGVKGNYLAYTDRLPGYDHEVEFKTYDPLYMVYKKSNEGGTMDEMTPKEKAEYFKEYYNNPDKSSQIKNGGVSINSLIAVGAFPSDVYRTTNNATETASIGTATIENAKTQIDPKKQAFAKQVFYMGQDITDTDALSNYNYNIVKNTVLTQIDWSKTQYIPPVAVSSPVGMTEEGGKFIFNTTAADDIVISNDGIKVGASTDKINAKIGNSDTYQNAVIITNGKVNIEAGTKFKGVIIAVGDVNILGSTNVDTSIKTEILYDEPIIRGIAAKYDQDYIDASTGNLGTKFSAVMAGEPLNNTTSTFVAKKKVESDKSIDSKYDADTYLKKGIWKIKKEKWEK